MLCSSPTPTGSSNAARRTQPLPAATTCRSWAASTRASEPPSSASSSMLSRSRPRRTARSRARSPSSLTTARTGTRGSPWCARQAAAGSAWRTAWLTSPSCRRDGGRWSPGRRATIPRHARVDWRYFELCLFTQVVNELKSGDLCLPGSGDYGDYRDQLVSWEEYDRDVAAYAEQAGVSADSAAFVADLKARLA